MESCINDMTNIEVVHFFGVRSPASHCRNLNYNTTDLIFHLKLIDEAKTPISVMPLSSALCSKEESRPHYLFHHKTKYGLY